MSEGFFLLKANVVRKIFDFDISKKKKEKKIPSGEN